jgi:hypothetical protein
MFGTEDSLPGQGTAPAGVQISAYALGGWPLSIIALVAASVVLGLFASLPLDASATTGTLIVTAAIAGYHFSQLPGEGPIFYPHGLFWSVLLVLLYAGGRFLFDRAYRGGLRRGVAVGFPAASE